MPQEIQLIITCPADKVDWAVAGILECQPVPLDEGGQPLYTVREHIRRIAAKHLFRIANEGNKRLHDRTRPVVEDVFI